MPHVRRSMLITVDADTEHVHRALVDELDARRRRRRRTFDGPIAGMPDTSARLDATIVESSAGTRRSVRARDRRATCACRSSPGSCGSRPGSARGARSPTPPPASTPPPTGADAPPPLKPLPVVPPVPFTPEQAGRLARAGGGGPGRQLLAVPCCRRTATPSPAPSTSPTRRSAWRWRSPGPGCWCRWSPSRWPTAGAAAA